MYCLCKANALRQFIRNVAHIEIEPALRYNPVSGRRPFEKSRRALSTFNALRIHQTSNCLQDPPASGGKEETETTNYTAYSGNDDSSDPPVRPSRPTEEAAAGPAILEITPDIIDQLAADVARDAPSPHDESSSHHPRDQTRDRRLRDVQAIRPSRGHVPLNLKYAADPSILRKTLRIKTPDESTILERLSKKSRAQADDDWVPPPRLPWQSQKAALAEKFEEGWAPRKRLSPDALAGIRAINAQFPEEYTVPVLAAKFEVSPEAIRRILKSKWRPDEEEEEDRKRRWYKRGQEVWTRYAELGLKPPRKWRDLGIGKREKGWRSKEKAERERQWEELRTTRNPNLVGRNKRDDVPFEDRDGFI